MRCQACGGNGCEACGGRGLARVTGCPLELITPDVWEVLDAADLAAKGSWPVAGGWLDQAAVLVKVVRRIWSLKEAAELENAHG